VKIDQGNQRPGGGDPFISKKVTETWLERRARRKATSLGSRHNLIVVIWGHVKGGVYRRGVSRSEPMRPIKGTASVSDPSQKLAATVPGAVP